MTPSKQPPLYTKPRLTKIYERSLLLTMLGSITLFSLADLAPSFLVIGFVGALIGYWYAIQGPSTISRLAINALLAVVVVLGLVNALQGEFSVSAFAFFSLLLLILKLFDLRTPRDHAQILVLSLGLIIAAALTSNSMPTGMGVFIMGFVFIRALMLFRIYALAPHYSQPAQAKALFNSTASIDLRSIQTATGFTCIIIAVLIFLVMPRSLGSSTLGQWGGATQSITTGFAEDVNLGRPGRISSSPTPVLRMSIRDRNDQPLGNENTKAIYLRGSVLTQYQQGRWVAHHDQGIPTTFRTRILEENQSLPLVSDTSRAEWTREYQFAFNKPDQNYGYLFTPWKPLELRATSTQARVGVDPITRMILLASQPISNYRVRTSDQELDPISFPSGYIRPAVDQTGVTPQIRDLARSIVSRAGIDPDPATRPPTEDIKALRAIETHLRTQYQYTLVSEPVPDGQDATEWFLFERQQGHCEYYASAFTLMTRSLNIPARVITGYVAAEFNDVTGSYTVRESNAHAWAEAMVAPNLWRTFDGTPQSDFHAIHEPEPTIFRSIAKFYEAIEQAWVTAFIGYDSDSRSEIFGDLSPNLNIDDAADTLQQRLATGRVQLLRQALITAGIAFVSTMTLGLIILFLTKATLYKTLKEKLKQLLTRSPNQSKTDRLAAKLQSHLHANLSTLGHPCPQGTPLQTHLRSINAQLPDPIHQAANLLYTHHFTSNIRDNTQNDFALRAQSLINALR
ncbi:MAG: DUF3488 domain-containing protein [Phycisphaerales bacterium]|nr:DUF3488 domain-containing protein [Phycisphaerales bacterium]